jgi:DNA mismatch repair protein MutS2
LRERISRLEFEERRAFQEERDRVVRDAAELQKLIRDARTELRKKRTRETVDAARKTLSDIHAKLDSGVWSPAAGAGVQRTGPGPELAVGDTVFLRDNNIKGKVTALLEKSREVEILAGQVKLRVSLSAIEKVGADGGRYPLGTDLRGRPPGAREPGGIGQPGKVTVPLKQAAPQLDLRGKRADEVEPALDAYLNDASLSNLNEVLIIHGLATGTVRQITRDFLAAHPLVKSFRSGTRGEGGEGTTVVAL